MLNEETIKNNIRCKWTGVNDAMQQLYIVAGANGGTLTVDDILNIWKREQEEQEQQEKIWKKFGK
jgi:hypothetical protein